MALSLPDIMPEQEKKKGRPYIGPEMTWEKVGLSVDQVAKDDTLPIIACFEEDTNTNTNTIHNDDIDPGDQGQGQGHHRTPLSSGLRIYSQQPVLLHTVSKKRRVRARSIHKDKDGRYMEMGQTLVIPEDYMGWFEIVPQDFRRSKSFLSIEDVALAMPAKFFTRSHIKALRVEGEGEDQKFLEKKIPPGSLLETKGKFKAKLRTRAQTGFFKPKTKEWDTDDVYFLQCVGPDSKEVMIPYSHKGKFNSVYDHGKVCPNAVYSMRDVITHHPMPVRVRLLFGKAPVVPCIFTGMLALRSVAEEQLILGSTVLNPRNVLFEIPYDAPVKVKVTTKDEQVKELASYKDAESLCKKYSTLFDAMIKLIPDPSTDHRVILHMPSDPKLKELTAEALRVLDLVTDINLEDEPKDHMFDSSDAGSHNSEDQGSQLPKGLLSDFSEFQTNV